MTVVEALLQRPIAYPSALQVAIGILGVAVAAGYLLVPYSLPYKNFQGGY
jgi:hypothetical protein